MDRMVAAVVHGGEGALDRWVVDERRSIVVSRPAGLMGILNATPDSFSDGGRHLSVADAVAAGEAMVQAGASWLDVGGESSRPGAQPVSADEECARVVPVITALRASGITIPISIDTTKAVVAAAALAAGASAINDISAGSDPGMFALAAAERCPLILMHMQGTPRTMQVAPRYGAVVDEIIDELCQRVRAAIAAGVSKSALLVDPGIGFGKTIEHNLALLRALPHMQAMVQLPLVVGVSRKSMFSTLLGRTLSLSERDSLSHIVHAQIAQHCALLRVHDVAGAHAALLVRNVLSGSDLGGAHAT
jgi:dihydropteroate synthase